MKYLTVGTNEIEQGLFNEVKDTDLKSSMKPIGGLWLTEYNEQKQMCSWVDFMMKHSHILFYKSRGISPFVQPCSLVNLKNNSHIYVLHNYQTLDYLMKCFPKEDKFSYEELSKYYDGIYVNYDGLFLSKYDSNVLKKFSSFGVSSMVLFNLDCIDYYNSGQVLITPYDYESGMDMPSGYRVEIDNTKKKVLKR